MLIEFIEHYHEARLHQGLGQRRPHEPAGMIPLTAVQWSAVIVLVASSTSTAAPREAVTLPRLEPRLSAQSVHWSTWKGWHTRHVAGD